MYLLFRSATVGGAQNQLLSDGLFGVPLGAHWLSGRPAQRPRRALPRRLRRPRRPVLAVGPPGEAGGPRRRGAGAAAPAAGTAAPRRVERVPAATAQAPVTQGSGGTAGTGAAAQARKGAGQSREGTAAQARRGVAAQARKGTGQQARKGVAAQTRKGTGQQARCAVPSSAGTRPDPAEALANSKAAGLLTRVLPYVTVVIAAFAPLAAALYLLTTVAWTLAERRLFLRRTLSPGSTVPGTAPPAARAPRQHGLPWQHGAGRRRRGAGNPVTLGARPTAGCRKPRQPRTGVGWPVSGTGRGGGGRTGGGRSRSCRRRSRSRRRTRTGAAVP